MRFNGVMQHETSYLFYLCVVLLSFVTRGKFERIEKKRTNLKAEVEIMKDERKL